MTTVYQGAFWILGDSVKSILGGDYRLICHKIRSDHIGNMLDEIKSKKSLSHKRLWNGIYKNAVNPDADYNYYPRGRVGINNGIAFINIIDACNTPKIIEDIIKEYRIDGLEIRVMAYDKNVDGGHRAFTLT